MASAVHPTSAKCMSRRSGCTNEVIAMRIHERYDGADPKLFGYPGLGGTQAAVAKRGERVDLLVDLAKQGRSRRLRVAFQVALKSSGVLATLAAAQRRPVPHDSARVGQYLGR